MLIVEGDNLPLRQEAIRELHNRLGDCYTFQLSGSHVGKLKDVVKLLNTDHRQVVRHGFTFEPMTDAERHMGVLAMRACGSVGLLCTRGPGYADYTHLPKVICGPDRPIGSAVSEVLDLWSYHLSRANFVFSYNGSGGNYAGPKTSIVGEMVQPFLPYDRGRRLAFTSHRGCSLYLHEALSHHPEARFYLTNAWKTEHAGKNKQLLAAELAAIMPHKIVAMGLLAQSYLADLRVDFVRTFHPQYWKRFKNKDLNELVQVLKPDF